MIESAQRVMYENLRVLAFGDITGSYVALGTQVLNPIRILSIVNTTDETILISFDGVDDKDVVAGPGTSTFDYGANSILPVGKLEQPAYTQIYIRADSALPTLGKVYATVIYASSY